MDGDGKVEERGRHFASCISRADRGTGQDAYLKGMRMRLSLSHLHGIETVAGHMPLWTGGRGRRGRVMAVAVAVAGYVSRVLCWGGWRYSRMGWACRGVVIEWVGHAGGEWWWSAVVMVLVLNGEIPCAASRRPVLLW